MEGMKRVGLLKLKECLDFVNELNERGVFEYPDYCKLFDLVCDLYDSLMTEKEVQNLRIREERK